MINFKNNKKNILTGDLLLFSSNKITSSMIKFFLESRYNHVGVAIRIKKGKIVNSGGKLYVFESNMKERYDELTKKKVKGVALLKIEDLYNDYDIIEVRHLNRDLLKKDFTQKVTEFILKNTNIKYTNNLFSCLGVWIGCPIGGIKRENNMFCSELVSYFYFDVLQNISSFRKPGKLYSPNDFLEGGDMDFIFQGREEGENIETVFLDQPNFDFVLFFPFIIGILIFVILIILINFLE